MPYIEERREELLQRLLALDPSLELIEPEDERFPEFLNTVTGLDSTLAQELDHAIEDDQAAQARSIFRSANGSPLGGAANVLNRFKGRSVRGQPRVRPMTLVAGGVGVVAVIFGLTAVIPEKKKEATPAQNTSAQVAKTVPVNPNGTPNSKPITDTPPTSTADASKDSVVPPITSNAPGSGTPVPDVNPAPISSSTPPAPAPSTDSSYTAAVPAPVSSYTPTTAAVSTPSTMSFPDTVATPVAATPIAAARPSSGVQLSAAPPAVSPPRPTGLAGVRVPTEASPATPLQPQGLVGEQSKTQNQNQPSGEAAGLSGSSATAASSHPGLTGGQSDAQAGSQNTGLSGIASSSASQPNTLQNSGLVVVETDNPPSQQAKGGGLVSSAVNNSQNGQGGLLANATTPAAPVVPAVTPAATSTSEQQVASRPYQPGSVLSVVLDNAVAVYAGASHPVWAKGEDGSIWRGEASLSNDRILLKFNVVLKDGQQSAINAYAESADGAGLGGHTRRVTKDTALAVMNGLLNAAVGFVKSQAAATTTYTANTVVQSEQPQNFWMAMGGGLAQAFVMPEVKASNVQLGELPKGQPVQIRVDLDGTPMGSLP